MEPLINQLIEAAKNNRKGLKYLKNAALTCQQYELAVQLRDIEKKAFPDTEEVKLAKEQSKKLNLAFRMVELNINEEVCWLISETLKLYNDELREFTIDDAIRLRQEMEKIFIE